MSGNLNKNCPRGGLIALRITYSQDAVHLVDSVFLLLIKLVLVCSLLVASFLSTLYVATDEHDFEGPYLV